MSAKNKVEILAEALPHIRRHHGKVAVVKYGGAAMADAKKRAAFARDVTLLRLVGVKVAVVHGGGPQINEWLARIGKESRFVEGMRYTDGETMDAVEMALGLVNKEIVRLINEQGGRAVGLSGKDAGMIRARRMKLKRGRGEVDIGLVGEVAEVNPALISLLDGGDFIPVVSPIAADDAGNTLNINADLAAGHLAAKLRADVFLMLTNTAGVLDKSGKLLPRLTCRQARALIKRGVIAGGMKPKVECAMRAVGEGVGSCRIIDGEANHSLLLEMLTDKGAGTYISP